MVLLPGCPCCKSGPCWKCYSDGTEYQCVGPDETAPDGWQTVGKCHPDEESCSEECPPCLTDRCDDPNALPYMCVQQSFTLTDRVNGSFSGAEDYFEEAELRLNENFSWLSFIGETEVDSFIQRNFKEDAADPYINPMIAHVTCQTNGLYNYAFGYERRYSKGEPDDTFPIGSTCPGSFIIENKENLFLNPDFNNYIRLYGNCTTSDDRATEFYFLDWSGSCQKQDRTREHSFLLKGYYTKDDSSAPIADWSCTLNMKATFSFLPCDDTPTKGARTMTTTKTTGGPGTELKKLLGSFGIQSKEKGCGCRSMQKKMDKPGWAESHKEEIINHLAAEAKKRRLPFIRLAAEKLVDLAIRRAEK